MQTPADNHNIPLLTEIISAPAPLAPPPATEAPAATVATTSTPASSVTAPAAITDSSAAFPTSAQLEQLRQDIHEGVMQQMLKQVDGVLHQHLQDHLAVILDNMADILKSRVRASLEQALAESVTQALAEEMARFENSKK